MLNQILRSFQISCIILLSSCTTWGDYRGSQVVFQPSPEQDDAYFEELTKSTREATVLHNFETRLVVYSTFLSPQFFTNLQERVSRILPLENLPLKNLKGRVGFFVSIFSPESQLLDLSHDSWSIFLGEKGKNFKISSLQKLKKDYPWDSFFPYVNQWSQEYLVLLDQTQDLQLEQLVGNNNEGFSLYFAHPLAKIQMTWSHMSNLAEPIVSKSSETSKSDSLEKSR